MPQQGHGVVFSISPLNLRSRLEASITTSKVTGVIFRPATFTNNKYRTQERGFMANSNRTKVFLPLVLGSLSIATGAAAADQDQSTAKSESPESSAADVAEDIGEIEVTGYRLSLRNAIDIKKNATVMKDAINAEDIADFPDANLAESLQRLPGVALDRDNGEGRGITVRGLGSDFTRVRLNGLETLSTAAASDSGTAPNRGRGFDFNVFASDLFSSLEVRKTASASTDEGSLGATVDLVTGKPLDYKGTRIALSMEDAFYENGGTHNPRIAGLLATQFFDDKMGFSISGAYSNAPRKWIDTSVRRDSLTTHIADRPTRAHWSHLAPGSPCRTARRSRARQPRMA